MDVFVALHAAAALLLVVAGLAKVARPAPTVDLFATLGLPARAPVAVGVGAAEIVVGGAALLVGGPLLAATTGAAYVVFALAVTRAIAAGATSCGCFGRVDAPPSWIHVAGNAVLAVSSFVATAGDTPLEVMDTQPAGGIGFVVLVGVLAGLALVAFTALPEALGARRDRPTVETFHLHDRAAALRRGDRDHEVRR